jgi:two-component system LytT family sensor kinase
MFSLRRWQTWALSFLFWTIYAIIDSAGSLAFIELTGQKPVLRNVIIWNFSEAYIWVLFTPLIYAITLRYSFARESWRRSLAVQMGMSVLSVTTAAWILLRLTDVLRWGDISTPFYTRLLGLALQDLPRYFVTAAVAQIVAYYGTLREREAESASLEARLAQAQLEILRAQMEPHFLFNTLNSIATLTRKNPASAEEMTLQLATLLRTSLDCAGSQEVPLRQELEFLQPYLEIQQTRFRDRLTIRLNVDADILSASVPSLILQPLVENAIRHGIAKSAAPGYLGISARRENGSVRIEISDNGIGMRKLPEQEGEGFGLRNTRARLRQLYGNRQEFRIEGGPDGGCRVTLAIPLPASRAGAVH